MISVDDKGQINLQINHVGIPVMMTLTPNLKFIDTHNKHTFSQSSHPIQHMSSDFFRVSNYTLLSFSRKHFKFGFACKISAHRCALIKLPTLENTRTTRDYMNILLKYTCFTYTSTCLDIINTIFGFLVNIHVRAYYLDSYRLQGYDLCEIESFQNKLESLFMTCYFE